MNSTIDDLYTRLGPTMLAALAREKLKNALPNTASVDRLMKTLVEVKLRDEQQPHSPDSNIVCELWFQYDTVNADQFVVVKNQYALSSWGQGISYDWGMMLDELTKVDSDLLLQFAVSQ